MIYELQNFNYNIIPRRNRILYLFSTFISIFLLFVLIYFLLSRLDWFFYGFYLFFSAILILFLIFMFHFLISKTSVLISPNDNMFTFLTSNKEIKQDLSDHSVFFFGKTQIYSYPSGKNHTFQNYLLTVAGIENLNIFVFPIEFKQTLIDEITEYMIRQQIKVVINFNPYMLIETYGLNGSRFTKLINQIIIKLEQTNSLILSEELVQSILNTT